MVAYPVYYVNRKWNMETYKVLKRLFSAALVLGLVCSAGCTTYIGYDGSHQGRVIDWDTGSPIEGAVVHGTWNRVHIGPGGASGSYYDSREVLTDKEGNFKINGVGLLILSNIDDMEINVFKAGYTQLSYAYWNHLKHYKTKDVKAEMEETRPLSSCGG